MQLLFRSWFRCMLQNKKAPLHRIVSKKTPKVSSSFNQIWKVKMSKLSEFTSFYRIYPIYILFLHILHIFWHLHYIKSFWHIENLTQRMVKLWSEVVELRKKIKNGQTPTVDKRWSVKSSSRCSWWWVRRGRRSLRVPPKLKGHWGSAIRTIRKLYCT